MAQSAHLPGAPPAPAAPVPPGAGTAVSPTGVPVTVWPAIPAPGRCPASSGRLPCPRRYTFSAAAAVIAALSRPGDLIAIPGPQDGAFLAAAAGTGRRACGLPGGVPGRRRLLVAPDRDRETQMPRPGSASGRAALSVLTCCPVPGCPPPGPAGDGVCGGAAEPDLGLLCAACKRALRPEGLLVVVTSTAWHPGWAGQVTAHARAAGLVYAQHIVAVHAPITGDRLLGPGPGPGAGAASSGPAHTSHLPVHTDLLVFAQPGRKPDD